MYEIFKKLCEKNGVSSADVARATGVAKATLSEWKKGTYRPKADKLQKIADYFGVSLDYLMTGQHPEQTSDSGRKYYFSDATAEAAQELFEEPGLRLLFDAARGADPEALKLAVDMLRKMKGEK
jgi:transcriptional regulator with XRE-family HTH domain